MISATPIAILEDNYAWLLRDEASGCLAIVDPAEAGPIEAAIDAAGGKLDLILITHHHSDHIGAVEDIRARYHAPVYGARADRQRLPRLDRELWEGSEVDLGASTARVMETPGHTRGHISYYFGPDGAAPGVLVCGDTLFSLGCGKLLEGTAAEMYNSLMKFAPLPPETLICCGHEYTASNARFALTAEPENLDLLTYAGEVDTLRAEGRPTLPSRLATELACNPFLRAGDVATLADLRRRKDHFR